MVRTTTPPPTEPDDDQVPCNWRHGCTDSRAPDSVLCVTHRDQIREKNRKYVALRKHREAAGPPAAGRGRRARVRVAPPAEPTLPAGTSPAVSDGASRLPFPDVVDPTYRQTIALLQQRIEAISEQAAAKIAQIQEIQRRLAAIDQELRASATP